MAKKVLMICANHWFSFFRVGSHQLARELVKKGYEVAFVSAPISPLHVLGRCREELVKRFKIYYSGGAQDLEGRLWTYVPCCIFPPNRKFFLKSLWVYRNWQKMTIPSVVKKVFKNGFREVDFIYFDNALQPFWLNEINFRKAVFRIPDNSQGFLREYTPALEQQEGELVKKVDLVIGTGISLTEKLRKKHHAVDYIEYLPNGVCCDHFTGKQESKPIEYHKISNPIAVYVGAIGYWFDFKLLKSLAYQLSKVTFVLIGPSKEAEKHFLGISNIKILGPRPYSAIPGYLQHADVGIIPFDVSRFGELIHCVNPLKLYEYMAAGLPVVATEWEELKHLNSPAFLCKTVDDFRNNICNAIQFRKDKSVYQDFAKKHDWSARAEKLIQLLSK